MASRRYWWKLLLIVPATAAPVIGPPTGFSLVKRRDGADRTDGMPVTEPSRTFGFIHCTRSGEPACRPTVAHRRPVVQGRQTGRRKNLAAARCRMHVCKHACCRWCGIFMRDLRPPGREGVGPIGASVNGPQGLHLHSTLAFSTQGTPLGFLDVQCWARDPADFGKKAKRHRVPIEEEESFKWLKSFRAVAAVQARRPSATLVSVGDREADLYELFAEATAQPDGPKLLVRAGHTRQLQAEQQRLWETMQSRPVDGLQALPVPRQGSRAARTAHLCIRHAAVSLVAPPRPSRCGQSWRRNGRLPPERNHWSGCCSPRCRSLDPSRPLRN